MFGKVNRCKYGESCEAFSPLLCFFSACSPLTFTKLFFHRLDMLNLVLSFYSTIPHLKNAVNFEVNFGFFTVCVYKYFMLPKTLNVSR